MAFHSTASALSPRLISICSVKIQLISIGKFETFEASTYVSESVSVALAGLFTVVFSEFGFSTALMLREIQVEERD